MAALLGAGSLIPRVLHAHEFKRLGMPVSNHKTEDGTGSQRLSVEKLEQWETLAGKHPDSPGVMNYGIGDGFTTVA